MSVSIECCDILVVVFMFAKRSEQGDEVGEDDLVFFLLVNEIYFNELVALFGLCFDVSEYESMQIECLCV